MKLIPSVFLVIFIGFSLSMGIVIYFINDTKQNEQTYDLNETIGACLTNSVDLGKVRVGAGVFLKKPAFEESVKQELSKKYATALFYFEYLEYDNGAIKAIKASMEIDEDIYSSTYIVNEV